MAVEPQSQLKAVGLAYDGYPLTLDDIPESDMSLPLPSTVTEIDLKPTANYTPPRAKVHDLDPDDNHLEGEYREVDYQNLVHVNNEIIALLRRMHMVRIDLSKSERSVIKHRIEYDQALRREIIRTNGASEKIRLAWAEMKCEELYKNWQIALQITKELMQFSKDIRIELDGLKEISNNLRRQIDIEKHM